MSENQVSIDDTVRQVNSLNKWLLGLFIALLFFLVIEIVFLVLNLRDSGPEEALNYSPQAVGNRIEGVEGPAIRLGEGTAVDVQAEKCNETDKTLVVQTRVSWDTIDPRGTIIEDWAGVQEIGPGCNDFTYNNPIPTLVEERTLQLIEDFPTLDCITWNIVGLDSPIDPNITPERWLTQPFCIYPPEDE